MTAGELYRSLADRGITLARDGDTLRVAPKELLTDDDRAGIREHKAALLDMLTLDDSALEALSKLHPVNWPAGPDGHGITILSDGHGWKVAFLSEDLEMICAQYERLRRAKSADRVDGVGASPAGEVEAGPHQADLFGGVGGTAGRAAGGALRKSGGSGRGRSQPAEESEVNDE